MNRSILTLLNWSTQLTCKAAWLMALVALCVSCALAQNTSSGEQEFTTSGNFTVPAGVTSLRIDAYGAGGGGGGADGSFYGGGGGGGAYNAGVIQVSPGDVLTIQVGQGGAGGGFPGGNGSSGGSTRIVNSSHVVVFAAHGGQGGQGATSNGNGNPGAGGVAGTFGTIRHAGQPGLGGGNPGGDGGMGYTPVGFVDLSRGYGAFSRGGNGGDIGLFGFPGVAGYLLITW